MIFIRDPSSPFNGIYSYLRQNSPNEVFQSTIIASASSTLGGRGQPIIVFDPFVTGSTNADNWHSVNAINSSITVSFFDFSVSLSEYSIRSRNDDPTVFPLEWVVEGTNDFILWSTIHYHSRNNDINGRSKYASFSTTNTNYFHSFRITQIGSNSHSSNSYYFILNKLEFFGELIPSGNNCRQSYLHCVYSFHISAFEIIHLVFASLSN